MSPKPSRPQRPGAGSRAGASAHGKKGAAYVPPATAGQAVNRFAEEKARREAAEQEEQRIAEEVKVTSGRGLGRAVPGRGKPEEAPAPLPADGSSPFGQYAQIDDPPVDKGSPVAVYAILASLIFMVGAVGLVVVSFGAVAYHQAGDPLGIYTKRKVVKVAKGKKASDTGKDPEGTWIPEEVRAEKRRRVATAVAAKNTCEEARARPWFATGTVVLKPGSPTFHSIEINCPQNGIRTRATFSNKRAASEAPLPSNEPCVVTFQGGQPAIAKLRAGQTVTCTFNPTRCPVTYQKPRPPIPECEGQD